MKIEELHKVTNSDGYCVKKLCIKVQILMATVLRNCACFQNGINGKLRHKLVGIGSKYCIFITGDVSHMQYIKIDLKCETIIEYPSSCSA